jgi:NADH-quinone oxidoreductase subunit A
MVSTALWPLLVYAAGIAALLATMLGLARLLARHRANAATNTPFESGVLPVGSAQLPITVEFYLVAILFVIFDLETVFLIAWSVALFELGWPGMLSAVVFIAVLLAALVYALRCGVLDWGRHRRAAPKPWEVKSD